MSKLKTLVNDGDVREFINAISDKVQREDSFVLLDLFQLTTGFTPKMWGSSIIGFGSYHYKSERSKQEGDWPLTGFSPRKQNISIYIMPGFEGYKELLKSLGKYKTSVSCLYVKRLSDIHLPTLKKLIKRSVVDMKKRHNVPQP